MAGGMFISFEGLDGSGKTTQLGRLATNLNAQGRDVVCLRQPGGTALGDRIRGVLLDSRSEAATGPIAPAAELALMFADRAQAIAEVIQPALDAGKVVLCDRFTDSSEAYQGGGRQLGSAQVLAVHRAVCGSLQPDLTILLLPNLTASLARARQRNQRHVQQQGTDENRFEREGDPFYARVHQAYEAIAAREPERVVTIRDDGSIEAIGERILELVSKALERRLRTGDERAGDTVAMSTAQLPVPNLKPGALKPESQKPRPLPGLRYSLPFYAFKPWVKLGDPIRLFVYLKKTFGNVSHYKFMGTPIVFINEPEYIREVLVTQASAFVKERTVRRMKLLLGEGLITSDDPIHIRQRRIAAPAFHRQRIAAYADQIVAIAAHAREQWKPEEPLDIAASSMALSLEIVARTLFDTEVDADIRLVNDEVNTIMGLYNFIIAFPRIEDFMNLPIPGIVKFRRSKARLDAVVDRLVREHREYSLKALAEGREPDRGDLLSMLLSSRDELLDETGRPTGETVGMSNEQVRDEVLTIFLAGYETVANALTWTWYLLSQNPAAEAKMHAELDAVLRTGTAQRLPTLADYPALRYTEQVFAEAMRLYPPAWAMGRMATRAIRLGPYEIPAGSHVFFSQYIMGRDPDYFPDPERFDPDRFSPEAKAARPKYSYFPFGGGSRQCIGEAFAWMEGTLSLAVLAQRWRLRFVPSFPVVLQPKITLRPKFPMMMRPEIR